MKRWLCLAGVLLAAALALLLVAEEPAYVEQAVSFRHGEQTLAGVLVLPRGAREALPCLVFVHGDGPLPRDAWGYYRPYWQRLAEVGYCSLAWDKPGVGESGGDWLAQSMDARADEVLAALAWLRGRAEVDGAAIGLIGFSQAGWVLPKVANRDARLRGVIAISPAVDWLAQSQYGTRMRLAAEAVADPQAELGCKARVDAQLAAGASHEQYLAAARQWPAQCRAELIDAPRWRFISANWRSNGAADWARVRLPVLAVFGGHDAYVDVADSRAHFAAWAERWPAPSQVALFAAADHGLMRATETRPDHQGLLAWLKLARLEWLGAEAFAPGYWQLLERWLAQLNGDA
jgi:hypothetical protein